MSGHEDRLQDARMVSGQDDRVVSGRMTGWCLVKVTGKGG